MEDWRIKCVFRVILMKPLYMFFIFLFTYINPPILHFNKKKMVSIYNNREKKMEDRSISILPILPILQRVVEGGQVASLQPRPLHRAIKLEKIFWKLGIGGLFIYKSDVCVKNGRNRPKLAFFGGGFGRRISFK